MSSTSNTGYCHVWLSSFIARLAVADFARGLGVGSTLLGHALKLALSLSELVGVQVVLVGALSDSAAEIYRRYGFESFVGNPARLFLPVQTIRATLGQ